MTLREAAQYCNVSVNAVYRWMERGLIEWVYNAGSKGRIYKDSLIFRPQDDDAARESNGPEAARQAGE